MISALVVIAMVACGLVAVVFVLRVVWAVLRFVVRVIMDIGQGRPLAPPVAFVIGLLTLFALVQPFLRP